MKRQSKKKMYSPAADKRQPKSLKRNLKETKNKGNTHRTIKRGGKRRKRSERMRQRSRGWRMDEGVRKRGGARDEKKKEG